MQQQSRETNLDNCFEKVQFYINKEKEEKNK